MSCPRSHNTLRSEPKLEPLTSPAHFSLFQLPLFKTICPLPTKSLFFHHQFSSKLGNASVSYKICMLKKKKRENRPGSQNPSLQRRAAQWLNPNCYVLCDNPYNWVRGLMTWLHESEPYASMIYSQLHAH